MGALGRGLGTVVAGTALFVAVGIAVNEGVGPFPEPEGCVAEVDGHRVEIDLEQAENAALIVAMSIRRGMPARAASIALATAYQESKIRNLAHGDRDSLGLFQQRPSQGWGTPDQVRDPEHSINAFYDALAKVEGYDAMPITEAAQAVQRSAYPDAYADHEADGRALASALTGWSPHAFWCTVDGTHDPAPDELTDSGLVPRADRLLREVEDVWGEQSLGGFRPGGLEDGHMEGSAHYDGRAIDVFFRPVTETNRRRGWAMASWLVANADRFHVETIIFDDRIWQARRSDRGWTDYDVPRSSAGDRAVLEHRDHVHVDVAD